MKKRYELQRMYERWERSAFDSEDAYKSLDSKKAIAKHWNDLLVAKPYRVVQILGRKVIKVIYPKGK